jgi:hypothetical protein
MISEEVFNTASQCSHYAMCKIDSLKTGLCPAGVKKHFVSYYPMGRMDIVHALAEAKLPVTERLVDIAETCNLCGICEKQCYFVMELRPLKVMKALKDVVDVHIADGKEILIPESDTVLDRLREVVGEQWASNDPAILACYSRDPGLFTGIQPPKYVVMPASREEVSSIVKICNEHQVPYVVRGNGSSVLSIIYAKDGLVMDMGRMKRITLNKPNWYVSVGPGVSGFELQKEASEHGLRVNIAEPEALVCANLMFSGIFSTFAASYGVAGSNYVNAEFVGPDGEIFDLNQPEAPNLFSWQPTTGQPRSQPGICTRADVKLHFKTGDEDGVLVPFSDFQNTLSFTRELGKRRIGLAIAVLNPEYMATFMAPTTALGNRVKGSFKDDLGIEFAVLVLGDQYALRAVRDMAEVVIDSEFMKALVLGMPNMAEEDWGDLMQGLEGGRPPYELILKPEMRPLIEAALDPSPENFAQSVPPDLRDFFAELYSRSEMTDMMYLNMFRIISSKMGRPKHMLPIMLLVPLDDIDQVAEIKEEFKKIGDSHGVTHDFGFITPIDFGKRAMFEYDYYFDHRDKSDVIRTQEAIKEAIGMIMRYKGDDPRIKIGKEINNQGFSRMENLLYL